MLYWYFLLFSAEFWGETELETGLNGDFAGWKLGSVVIWRQLFLGVVFGVS